MDIKKCSVLSGSILNISCFMLFVLLMFKQIERKYTNSRILILKIEFVGFYFVCGKLFFFIYIQFIVQAPDFVVLIIGYNCI